MERERTPAPWGWWEPERGLGTPAWQWVEGWVEAPAVPMGQVPPAQMGLHPQGRRKGQQGHHCLESDLGFRRSVK